MFPKYESLKNEVVISRLRNPSQGREPQAINVRLLTSPFGRELNAVYGEQESD
jgi:hypothetical protein